MSKRALLLLAAAASATASIACSPGAGYAADVDAHSSPGASAAPAAVATEVPRSSASSASSCTDRESILAANRAAFDARKNGVQALVGDGITSDNWSTFATTDTWGPHAATFGLPSVSVGTCADAATLTREYYLAVVNYWVEQGLNYCHHHVPGWTPPNTGAFRNSTAGSTSGGVDGMTCTSNRFADGHQRVQTEAAHVCSAPDGSAYCDSPDEIESPYASLQVNWNGVDCSDFTSWAYDFAGITRAPLHTGIGAQACDPDEAGVLFDIDASNIDTVFPSGVTLESKLLPGDMLYVQASDSEDVAHVITWTGLRWNDLKNSGAQSKFDPAQVGEPGSRLGGDFESYGMKIDALDTQNPWMIVDSHYAGPAYRPFTGWYKKSLSHVRRVIDAVTAASDPVLAPYRLLDSGEIVTKPLDGTPTDYRVLVASVYEDAVAHPGHRLLVAPTASNSCLHPAD